MSPDDEDADEEEEEEEEDDESEPTAVVDLVSCRAGAAAAFVASALAAAAASAAIAAAAAFSALAALSLDALYEAALTRPGETRGCCDCECTVRPGACCCCRSEARRARSAACCAASGLAVDAGGGCGLEARPRREVAAGADDEAAWLRAEHTAAWAVRCRNMDRVYRSEETRQRRTKPRSDHARGERAVRRN